MRPLRKDHKTSIAISKAARGFWKELAEDEGLTPNDYIERTLRSLYRKRFGAPRQLREEKES